MRGLLIQKTMFACFFAVLVHISGGAFTDHANVHAQDEKQPTNSQQEKNGAKNDGAAFKLADVEYFHRFTDMDLHEYTPDKQEDLEKWTDMVTINYYNNVKDSDGLASTAKAVEEIYKMHRAKVVRVKKILKTQTAPAEHLIVVTFSRPEFQEITLARFRLNDGVGTSVIYSHRMYGDSAKDDAVVWLKKNRDDFEKNLLKWDEMPKRPAKK